MAYAFFTSAPISAKFLLISLSFFSPFTLAQSIPHANTINEAAERSRIENSRQQHMAVYEKNRKACYQQLAVTPCQLEARNEKNAHLADLKRQENALNDLERKRKGAERIAKIDARSAPEQLLQKNEHRAQALEQSEQRALSQQRKQADQLHPSAAFSKTLQQSPASPTSTVLRTSQAKNNVRVAKPRQASLTPEEIKQNLARADQRQKDAAERQSKSIQREQARKKPAAAPLPMPQN